MHGSNFVAELLCDRCGTLDPSVAIPDNAGALWRLNSQQGALLHLSATVGSVAGLVIPLCARWCA